MEAKTGFLYWAKNPADLTRTAKTYFASDSYLEVRRSQVREFAMRRSSWTRVREILEGFIGGCLRNKRPEQRKRRRTKKFKKLLAMIIGSDTNSCGGASLGSISRSYEVVGKDPSVYPYFERLFRSALRRHRLPFQWVGGERAVFA